MWITEGIDHKPESKQITNTEGIDHKPESKQITNTDIFLILLEKDILHLSLKNEYSLLIAFEKNYRWRLILKATVCFDENTVWTDRVNTITFPTKQPLIY